MKKIDNQILLVSNILLILLSIGIVVSENINNDKSQDILSYIMILILLYRVRSIGDE